MEKKLQNQLYKKYPKIFRQKNLPMTETCMCWGICFEKGWYWLIDNLCNTIQRYIDDNEHLKIPQVEAVQLKEKYGGLCFYYDGGDANIGGMVWLAEAMSYSICEICGSTKNVTVNETGWITTRCKRCRDKEKRTKKLKK